MPRRRPQSPEQIEERVVEAVAATGGNVPDEVVLKHYREITRLEAKAAQVRQELSQAWKGAEAAGIEKKPFKANVKLMAMDPASADAYLRKLNQYTVQLGLMDRINGWKQAEEREANAGSADRADADLKKPKPSDAPEEPQSGGRDDAIYNLGFMAGEDGAARTTCPGDLLPDDAEIWYRGHHAGALKRVRSYSLDVP